MEVTLDIDALGVTIVFAVRWFFCSSRWAKRRRAYKKLNTDTNFKPGASFRCIVSSNGDGFNSSGNIVKSDKKDVYVNFGSVNVEGGVKIPIEDFISLHIVWTTKN